VIAPLRGREESTGLSRIDEASVKDTVPPASLDLGSHRVPAENQQALNILILEDEPPDAELMTGELAKAGLNFTAKRVATRADFTEALEAFAPDVVLVDCHLPDYSGAEALAHERRVHPEIPVVIVTGTIGDEAAVELLKAGAKDYVLKSNLVRLAPAVERVISVERGIRARKAAERAMRESEAKFRSVVEQNVAGITIIRDDGTIAYVNPYFARLTGCTLPELIGRPLLDLVPEDEKAAVVQQLGAQLSSEAPFVQHRSAINARGGGRIEVLINASQSTFEGRPASIAVVIDITEQKRVTDALRASEVRYRDLFEATADAIMILEPASGRFTSANPATVTLFRAKDEADFLSRKPWEHSPEWQPDGRASEEKAHEMIETAMRTGSHLFEWTHRRFDGAEFLADVLLTRVAHGGRTLIDATVRDITERKQADAALYESQRITEGILNSMPVRVFWKDKNLRYLGCNAAFARDAGFAEPQDLIGKDDFQMGWRDQAELYRARDREVIESGCPEFLIEEPQTTPTGETLALLTSKIPLRDAHGEIEGVLGTYMDITERKRSEERLREEEVKFRGLVEQEIAGIYIIAADGTLAYVNPYFAKMFGYAQGEVIGRSVLEFVAGPEKEAVREQIAAQITGKELSVQIVTKLLRKDGAPVDVLAHGSLATYQGRPASIGVVLDISERTKAERTLQRLNRTLKTLSSGNEILVRATSEGELLSEMCRVIVELGGYRMAWIGEPQQDAGKTVKPVASAGPTAEYFARSSKITWDDAPTGQGICGRAIRSGEPQTSQNSRTDLEMAPWSARFEEYGLASAAGFPLKDDSGVFAVLVIYSSEPDAFDADQLALLQELASDLAFGVRTLREHSAREVLELRWRASLEGTVGAIASTVEMRDPYTSGHQQRVAKLAVAIAHRLSMSEHDVHGIYLAGIIHDVGKINVPAEILNRPGKLSKIEFQLIQAHTQAGYDIVKGVDFPWPIAQMVLQHHERLDGSGYPQGIKGDAMLRGAKLLAVADVVEAMMSHRPYRPALGIDAALAEIENGKGTLFDPEAVDACVALFREDGFHFD